MSDSNKTFGSGILSGLKKVLFQNSEEENFSSLQPSQVAANHMIQTKPEIATREEKMPDTSGGKEMKLRVYQLLENLNKPGIDFFEVWNAAVEMGGANSTNLRSAFTSLRYADKSLTKSRLIESGQAYINELSTIIESESKKRSEEKSLLDKEMAEVRSRLEIEISAIEQQISMLQQKLLDKKSERENINSKYEPRISEINKKIAEGKQSVSTVLAEMQQVLDIIKKDLN